MTFSGKYFSHLTHWYYPPSERKLLFVPKSSLPSWLSSFLSFPLLSSALSPLPHLCLSITCQTTLQFHCKHRTTHARARARTRPAPCSPQLEAGSMQEVGTKRESFTGAGLTASLSLQPSPCRSWTFAEDLSAPPWAASACRTSAPCPCLNLSKTICSTSELEAEGQWIPVGAGLPVTYGHTVHSGWGLPSFPGCKTNWGEGQPSQARKPLGSHGEPGTCPATPCSFVLLREAASLFKRMNKTLGQETCCGVAHRRLGLREEKTVSE